MKCAVLVLCAATAAAAFKDIAARRSRHHYRGDVSLGYQQQGSYQQVPYQQGYQQSEVPYQQVYQSGEVPYQQGATYQYSGEVTPNYQYQLSGEATPSYQYQPQYQQYAPPSNSLDATYQHGYQQQQYQPSYPTQYYPDINPTEGTPVQYGAPLAPYPAQFNVHQQAQYGGPLPGYTDLFGPTSPPGGSLITPTAVIKRPTTTATKAPTTQAPNNIFSLLLSLSQSSSGLSQPRTTKRPVATIATSLATGQPPPKAQIFSFTNLPAPFQGQPAYYQQRRIFNPFSLE